jgi:hypothetical protein
MDDSTRNRMHEALARLISTGMLDFEFDDDGRESYTVTALGEATWGDEVWANFPGARPHRQRVPR